MLNSRLNNDDELNIQLKKTPSNVASTPRSNTLLGTPNTRMLHTGLIEKTRSSTLVNSPHNVESKNSNLNGYNQFFLMEQDDYFEDEYNYDDNLLDEENDEKLVEQAVKDGRVEEILEDEAKFEMDKKILTSKKSIYNIKNFSPSFSFSTLIQLAETIGESINQEEPHFEKISNKYVREKEREDFQRKCLGQVEYIMRHCPSPDTPKNIKSVHANNLDDTDATEYTEYTQVDLKNFQRISEETQEAVLAIGYFLLISTQKKIYLL